VKNGCCANLLAMVVVVQFALSSVHPTQSVGWAGIQIAGAVIRQASKFAINKRTGVFSVCSVPSVVKAPLVFCSYSKNLRVN
jgi:hypothetical protein